MYINKKVGLSCISVLETGLNNDKLLWLIKYMEDTLPSYMLSKYIRYVVERSPIGIRLKVNVDTTAYEQDKVNNTLRESDIPVVLFKDIAKDSLVRFSRWFKDNEIYVDNTTKGVEIKISIKNECDIQIDFYS